MKESESPSKPQVLGIALVVEELGKGSRLIFRYPSVSSSSLSSSNNIFFTLPPRVFAKLFHTKQSLCGQPVTLLIDGTMICCRSVMLQNNTTSAPMEDVSVSAVSFSSKSMINLNSNASTSTTASNINTSASANTNAALSLLYSEGLVMFSLVVALLPVQRQTRKSSHINTSNMNTQDPSDKVSAAYPIIRRIHLSLARVCSVLEREERRCLYVSRQVAMLMQVANSLDVESPQMQQQQEQQHPSEADEGKVSNRGTSISTLHIDTTVEGSPKPNPISNSSATIPMEHNPYDDKYVHQNLKAEDDYERTERMLSAKLPLTLEYEALECFSDRNGTSSTFPLDPQVLRKLMIPLHGNLASELSQVYYSLGRDDSVFRNPAYLLSNREGIVYVNNHIAVNIEAAVVSEDSKLQYDFRDNKMPLLRPYHTILFPRVSARELLMNIHTSFSSTHASQNKDRSNPILQDAGDLSQRRLEKVLSVCDPTKSLNDISFETALPLSVVTDIALRLVESGVCIAVPQFQSSVKFCCQHDAVQKMASLRMPFAQEFSHIPIMIVTSALTVKPNYNKTFGDIIRYCKEMARIEDEKEREDMEESLAAVQGEAIEATRIPMECQVLTNCILNSVKSKSHTGEDGFSNLLNVQQVESTIRKMASWLRSHLVIVELKDYLVSVRDESPAGPVPSAASEDAERENESLTTMKKSNSAGDMLYQWSESDSKSLYDTCMKNKYFSGNISTSALAWRIGKKQMEVVRDYGIRENLLQVTTRIPCIGEDDWGAP